MSHKTCIKMIASAGFAAALVLGGSGAVGQSAISYAASKGAQVWGQARTAEKADAVRAIGAKDAVVTDAAGCP